MNQFVGGFLLGVIAGMLLFLFVALMSPQDGDR